MWVLYGLLSFENRMSRWILNIEPPTGRGSATRLRLTVRNAGPTSLMNWRNGSLTDSSYRSLFALNQSRSLLRFSSRRNANVSSPKYPTTSPLVFASAARGYRPRTRRTTGALPMARQRSNAADGQLVVGAPRCGPAPIRRRLAAQRAHGERTRASGADRRTCG